MKIGYQLKQVRERLAKGLVDKGILRTEKRNFLLFDMATHPVADGGAKDEIRRRVRVLLTTRTVVLPPTPFLPEEMEFRYLRTIAMVCAAYAANVLENALATLGHETRERAFAQVDELLAEYSQWPFGKRTGGGQGIGQNLNQVTSEEVNRNKDRELQLEVSVSYQIISGLFANLRLGGCCMFECFHTAGLASMILLTRTTCLMMRGVWRLEKLRFERGSDHWHTTLAYAGPKIKINSCSTMKFVLVIQSFITERFVLPLKAHSPAANLKIGGYHWTIIQLSGVCHVTSTSIWTTP